MTKSDEAVLYMVSIWDEVKANWRNKPDHVAQKFIDAEDEARERRREYYRKQREQ